MILNFESYNFTLARLRYLDAAVEAVPAFHPDGQDGTYVTGLVTEAKAALAEFLTKYSASNAATGALDAAFEACHQRAVTVYGCMKSCYRTNSAVSASIRRLPKQDYNAQTTFIRMTALLDLWAILPNLPSTNASFTAGTVTKQQFETECGALETKLREARVAELELSKALTAFNEQTAEWDRFVTAALAQGRALFGPETPARAVIEQIPTAPATQAPDEAIFGVAESPSEGVVHLTFSAEGASSFRVVHKGPADTVFTEAADVLLPGDYVAAGLPAGVHQYKVVGVNSRGEGPESEPVSVEVAEAQAA